MKKHILFCGLILSAMALASCNGDYEDWAMPQQNAQEASAAAYGLQMTAGTDADIVMPKTNDSVNIVTIAYTNADITGVSVKNVKVNGTEIPVTLVNNKVMASANVLDSIIEVQNSSRASVKRTMSVVTSVAAHLTNGDAVALTDTTKGSLTPEPLPAIDANGYFLEGDFVGYDWDPTKPLMMTKIADGVYQVLVETKNEGDNWFKFYGGSSYKGSTTTWDDINAVQMGCRKNGDNATSNFLVYTGDKYEVQTPVISGAGKWVVRLDMNNLTYSISKPILYLAGAVNGWKQAPALMLGSDGKYTGYVYVTKDGFKFTSQADWNGTNYGAGSSDGVLSTDGGAGNLSVADGFYYASVDANALTYTLTQITNVSIIGKVNGNWDTDTDLTFNAADNSYSVTAAFSAGEFKFRINHDWGLNLGGTTDALSQNGANLSLATAGTYTITVWPSYDGASHCTVVAASAAKRR